MFKKILLTVRRLKKTASQHYGNKLSSIPKFLYFSLFRMNTFIIFENDFSRAAHPDDLDPGFRVIQPTIEELEKLRKDRDLPREFYCDKIDNVKTCFLALWNNEIAYIHWVYTKGDHSRFLKLANNVAEINYVTTLPKFRGKQLSAKMFMHTTKYLQEKGYAKVFIICHKENPPLIKSALRAGFSEMGRLKAWGPLNKKIHA